VRLSIAAVVAAGCLGLPGLASSSTEARVAYSDVLPRSGTGQVTVTTHRAASFRVLLLVPVKGRARLFLLGARAPKGGPLMDTKTTPGVPAPCPRSAGSYVCRSAYEALPKGTYTWRIVWNGPARAPVELTVGW
jgi:hypothetical protein